MRGIISSYTGLKNLFSLLFIFSVLFLILFTDIGEGTFFGQEQQLTLSLLLIAVYVWIIAPMPLGAGSILILALMMVFGLVDNTEEAFEGFLSSALYFIFALSVLSKVFVNVGIDQWIAGMIRKLSRNSVMKSVIGLPVFILLLPIVLPSAIARFKMLQPLVGSLNERYGFSPDSTYHKYSLFIIGMLNQLSTMVVVTGGGFSVLTVQLLRDFGVADIGWTEWFLLLAPPVWIGALIFVLILLVYLRVTGGHILTDESADEVSETAALVTYSKEFIIVLVGFVFMILAWILLDQNTVPLLLPPMLLIAVLALPGINLITSQVIRGFDWENFLLLGTSFSLGLLLAENDTADAMARVLMMAVPENSGILFKVVVFSIIVFILRFMFIVPSSAIIVIFPIVISYADLIGVADLQLSMLLFVIIGSMLILPIHTPTVYLAYQTGVIKNKDQLIIGLLGSLIMTGIAIVALFLYW
ncbi:anion permease [Salinicoccus sp. ID82-1]|uniref:SLC13 family permease n=1 Tax=Salinicoccus sp. ID82-1 TaxID=2820269 RepID=UPI001EFF6FDB|nr:SLC13 family permease [Salinicoccus sp. ID82-1]MCG1009657.1 anion permease [Salinicoccus sp. ID82-1]